jgi:DNA invertase Pin-like site-specific DNA recombinase
MSVYSYACCDLSPGFHDRLDDRQPTARARSRRQSPQLVRGARFRGQRHDARPGLDALMKGVSHRDFDMMLAWSVDRLGRSLTSMIRERVLAGISRAATSSTRSGKPIGRPRIGLATEASIRAALQKGDIGMRKVAVQFGVETGTVQRIAKAAGLPA